jgi:hypothetical protein
MEEYDPLEHMVQEVGRFVNPVREEFKPIKTKIRPRRPPKKKPDGGLDPPERKLPKKTKADKDSKRDVEGRKKDGWSKAAIAAGVVGVAVAGTIAGLATANMIACDNATMTITDVYPTGKKGSNASSNTSSSFFGGLFTSFASATAALSPPPTTVDIKFKLNNDYKINEGHDEVEISGTGTELDGMGSIVILKLVDPNTIRVECATNDCSNVYATTGTAEPQCSIEDAINKGLKDAVQGPIDLAKDFLSTATDAFTTFVGPIVLIICGILALVLIVPLLFSLFKKSPVAPKPAVP